MRRFAIPGVAFALCAILAAAGEAHAQGEGFLARITESIEASIAGGGGVTVVTLAFLAGFASSFTPCIYPLIPITLSIFGATGDIPRAKAFFLSLCYVLGIAVTYTALGIFSAKTGFIFGSFLGNPLVVGLLCLAILALALYTLEVFHLSFASQLQNRASQVGGRGFAGAFLMGSVSGLVAAPCIGPVLIVILGYVAASGNAAWGGLILFSYAMGLGLIFLVLGTFSGLIRKLPRSGNWLHGVKFMMGVALLMVAVFLADSFVDLPLGAEEHMALLLGIVATGILLAAVAYRRDYKSLRFVSAVLVAAALYRIAVPDSESLASSQAVVGMRWHSSIDEALTAAADSGGPVMVDLFADWCAACKELDAHTFSNARVMNRLKSFTLAKLDFTSESDATLALSERYQIVGLPSVLFLDAGGKEIPGSRITQFMPPEEFLEHLEKKVRH